MSCALSREGAMITFSNFRNHSVQNRLIIIKSNAKVKASIPINYFSRCPVYFLWLTIRNERILLEK